MKEIALMDPSKETENKLRWQCDVDGVGFKLYIPKWRVPRPWPVRIIVSIFPLPAEGLTVEPPPDTYHERTSLERPIIAVVSKVREHTQTVRFAPLAGPEGWEIGEPYIPYVLLPNPLPEKVRLEVRWDRSAGTWSDE